jgi:undecaprenyl diphosphate synthase
MEQSSSFCSFPGLHVAIIMDGNGRWATARGRPRVAGHRAGADAVRRVVEASRDYEIGTLTLFAFSSDNWQRPPSEVGDLMKLFRAYLIAETIALVKHGIRISVIGRRDRLGAPLFAAIGDAEKATAGGRALHLRIAVDYSARDAILRAAQWAAEASELTRETFSRLLEEAIHSGAPAPGVDLLIRTGGEQRLSDFLLWESAYAEMVFTTKMWPEFGAADLEAAIREFHSRERRFGGISAPRPLAAETCVGAA